MRSCWSIPPARRARAGADDGRSDQPPRSGCRRAHRHVAAARRCSWRHRRLSIIDLSAAADQPFSKDGLHLSYNGELYNYRELRDTLRGRGVRFRTESDTEVVLECWRQWGPAGLARLRGMFAFAIYDERTAALTLVRDPLGIKPLYVLPRGRGIVFASELKALVAAVGPELHRRSGRARGVDAVLLPAGGTVRHQGRSSSSRRDRGPSGGPTAPPGPDATGSPPRRPWRRRDGPPADLGDGARGVRRRPHGRRRTGGVLPQRWPGLEPDHRDGRAARPRPSRRTRSRSAPEDQRLEAMPDDADLRPQDGGPPRDPAARDRDQPGRGRHAPPGRRRAGRADRRSRPPSTPCSCARPRAMPASRSCCPAWVPTSCSAVTASTWPACLAARYQNVPELHPASGGRRRAWTGSRSRPAGAACGTPGGPSAS